ncbi:hypothetical protein [Rhodopila sp.]|uniref:hypothetical protein n=1 Tax=Rhodopila sp. TaxID=2480087 RepID=UPI003D13C7CE
MATYVAETELVDPQAFQAPVARPNLAAEFRGTADTDGSAARGILIAVSLSLPFWVLVGFAIYLLA